MAEPTNAQINSEMAALVRSVDVDTITMKQFIKALSARMGGVDLKPRKKFIKVKLTEIIDEMQRAKEESSESDEEEEVAVAAAPEKKRGSGGLGTKKAITPELKAFLCTDETDLARTEIVKMMWDYIREHNLQDPDNKRDIILDDAMRKVFGVDRFSMFHMAKYISAHVHPFKPVDLTPKPKKPVDEEKKRKRPKNKKEETKTKRRKVKKEPGEKKKAPLSFTQPYKLSTDLIEITGEDGLSRPQVTSKLWEYIKKHDLQFPEDKRTIICDDKFRRIMADNERVTMFEMNRHVSAHLLEKLPHPDAPVENAPAAVSPPLSPSVAEEEEAETEDEGDEF